MCRLCKANTATPLLGCTGTRAQSLIDRWERKKLEKRDTKTAENSVCVQTTKTKQIEMGLVLFCVCAAQRGLRSSPFFRFVSFRSFLRVCYAGRELSQCVPSSAARIDAIQFLLPKVMRSREETPEQEKRNKKSVPSSKCEWMIGRRSCVSVVKSE